MKKLLAAAVIAFAVLFVNSDAFASKFVSIKVVDKDYLMIQIRDGEIHYRDNGTGESAYMGGIEYLDGDDTLFTFMPRLDAAIAAKTSGWSVSSADDKGFGIMHPAAVWRKAKPMHIRHDFEMELEHWLFLKLPKSMKQGSTYTVTFPEELGVDEKSASVKFDIWNSQSEAVHVNIMGYSPSEKTKMADLYLWLGDGGQRDYKQFEGRQVWLMNVNTGAKKKVGKVRFWKAENAGVEAGGKNLTASDVWKLDFAEDRPGKYRLVVDGVGCSMDFDIDNEIYYEPYRYSVRGYYYMRIGEPADPEHVWPVPRQPRFIPEVDPVGFTIYLTDLHPWHPDWRKTPPGKKLSINEDEPKNLPISETSFWDHRLPGNPVNTKAVGGHSDACDWDRHLAHVFNVYDLLLPYILTEGRISEDALGIRESGNGIPDIIDEALNEVDFFLNLRDGEAYSMFLTNPTEEWMIMFQGGSTTMAAWANAANCAMSAAALKIAGKDDMVKYYTDEAIKAYRYASRQENLQLDDRLEVMYGRDFRMTASAYLYNVTGDREWEDALAADSQIKSAESDISGSGGQIWATAAYLVCPHERHYPELYANMKSVVNRLTDSRYLQQMELRPSRRAADDPRHRTSENLQIVMLAHKIATSDVRRAQLERAMYAEAGWGLGRNPANIIEMTGLGQRHLENIYSSGHNDNDPGTHPGQTPYNGIEVWTKGDGGDVTFITDRCYPEWSVWPQQESYFNQRYLWVNSEFTPRETMRGKMALLGYLYGIRK